MKSNLISVLLLIFLLDVDISFSTRITAYLCSNQANLRPPKKLICDNVVEQDPRYHSCSLETFRYIDNRNLETGDCRGGSLDPTIPDKFPDIRTYDISYHGIYNISNGDLRFNFLEMFIASHNRLMEIPANLFIQTPQLREIDLSYNYIEKIAEGVFFEIENANATINLQNNPLKHIDGKIFLPLQLRFIEFSITWDNVEQFDISSMRNVYDFGFKESPNKNLCGLKIGIQRKPIKWAHSTTYYNEKHLKNLKVFNASNSGVHEIEKIIGVLTPSIEVIDVSMNTIRHLNESVFGKFINLQYLSLQSTELKSFDFNEFNKRQTLTVLDLSYNLIDRINFTPYAGSFENLATLNLVNNELDEIDFVTRWNFPKLSSLGISMNRFSCKYLKEFLRQWPNLDLFNANPSDSTHERGINCLQ